MFIDSHCHLNYKGLIEDQAGVISRARAVGVSAMLNISTRESEWDEVVATTSTAPGIWASIGIHPHEADAHPDIDTQKLVERAAHPRVIAMVRLASIIITTKATVNSSARVSARTSPPRVKPAFPSLFIRVMQKRIRQISWPMKWGRVPIPASSTVSPQAKILLTRH
jgi:TatD related DNase